MNEDHFWAELCTAAHESDDPLPIAWKPYYWSLFCLSRELKPHRICEIGVRAGYSAYTMLRANPTARLLGVEADLDETTDNTHGGRKGMYRHALSILADYDFDVLIANSQNIQRLPASDLVYVDGDHSQQGCRSDLELAARSTDTILVDDFEGIPSVRRASLDFLETHPGFESRRIDNDLTGFLLIERSSRAATQASRKW